MAGGNKSMEVDSSDGSTCNAQSSKEKLLVSTPVPGGSSGVGLPYAPEGWPCVGDTWTWKVGKKRKTNSGHWHDRYLYPPRRLKITGNSKWGFQSRVSLEQYIRKEFPEADIDAFFASFIWRIPAAETAPGEGDIVLSKMTDDFSMLCALVEDITFSNVIATMLSQSRGRRGKKTPRSVSRLQLQYKQLKSGRPHVSSSIHNPLFNLLFDILT